VEGRCELRSISSLKLEDWSDCMRELSLHILDALQNSLEAGATLVELTIEEDLAADLLTITIGDNGRGMSEDQLARVYDPFFTTRSTRHVGLGIPLFRSAAQHCSGDLNVTSQLGEGTTLCATFQHSHIDRAPLGDIAGTLLSFILSGSCDLHYIHRVNGCAFEFRTDGIRAELGNIPLTHPRVRKWLHDFIDEGEQTLQETD
jgi:anti-sigma regulatory factor (Ser/Thr protein kinase)